MDKEYLFRLELDVAYPQIGVASRYFHSLKSLNQWLKRNETASIFDHRKYILTEKGYERFHIFGNTVVTLTEMQEIINNIEISERDRIQFIEHLKNKSIQK